MPRQFLGGATRVRAALVATPFLLGGCLQAPQAELTGVGAVGSDGPSVLRAAGGPIDPDMVRAPELFQASGTARWNGLGTARGVWVAHPRVSGSRPIRIVNAETGVEIDGMLYRADHDLGDVVTVSSDVAAALGLAPDVSTHVLLFGLRPKGTTTAAERRQAALKAEGELAARVLRLGYNDLLQLVAATMRGMGYATAFEQGPPGDDLSAIRAFPRPDAGFQVPAVRVVVRPIRLGPATVADLGAVRGWLTGSGDLGVVVSVAGFDGVSGAAGTAEAPALQLVDLPALLHIWQARYAALSGPDQDLLPLEPVYFLARR